MVAFAGQVRRRKRDGKAVAPLFVKDDVHGEQVSPADGAEVDSVVDRGLTDGRIRTGLVESNDAADGNVACGRGSENRDGTHIHRNPTSVDQDHSV